MHLHYNGGQDLIGIDCKDSLGVRQVGFSHVIDKAGNKLHEVKLHDLPRSHAYLHDGLHRLVSYTEGTPDPDDPNTIPLPIRQQQWNLDKLGNWKTFTETTDGATITQTRAHNKVNELRSITVGPAVTDLKYDAAGNLKDDTVFHYRYDEEQRLKAVFTSVVDPVTGNRVAGVAIARYKYDALGRRILKRLLNPDGSTQLVTRFYYDGDRVVEERTGGQNLPSRQYIWGNYVDELLVNDPVDAMGNVQLTGRTYALQNSTFSVHALVNDAGAVVERYDYTPYGAVTVLTAAGTPIPASLFGNVYLFTGRELDAESGLVHNRARAYSPKLGRFIQRDTNFRDGMNLYELVASRPTVKTDPSGRHLITAWRPNAEAIAKWLADVGLKAYIRQLPSGWWVIRYDDSGMHPDDVTRAFRALPDDWTRRVFNATNNTYRHVRVRLGHDDSWHQQEDTLAQADLLALGLGGKSFSPGVLDYLVEGAKGAGEGAKVIAHTFSGGYFFDEDIQHMIATGRSDIVVAQMFASVSKEILVSVASGPIGGMMARAAAGGGWLARGANALMKAKSAWDKLEKIKSEAEMIAALLDMAAHIDEFIADAMKNGIDEEAAIDAVTDLILDRLLGTMTARLHCFPGDTPVHTAEGLRAISRLAVGETVRALNCRTGDWEFKRIAQVFSHHHDGEIVRITVAGRVIEATKTHPFRVLSGVNLLARPPPDHVPEREVGDTVGGRWVDAGDLQIGDEVMLASGETARVESLERRAYSGAVYNLEVEGNHTYAVGAAGVAVHNSAKLKRQQIKNGIIYTLKTKGHRYKQRSRDANVNPSAPTARPTGKIGTSPAQHAALSAHATSAGAAGATDIRVNQQQVAAGPGGSVGSRVGINRPDLQYTDASGQRVYVEYERPGSRTRGQSHAQRISANDPTAKVIVMFIP